MIQRKEKATIKTAMVDENKEINVPGTGNAEENISSVFTLNNFRVVVDIDPDLGPTIFLPELEIRDYGDIRVDDNIIVLPKDREKAGLLAQELPQIAEDSKSLADFWQKTSARSEELTDAPEVPEGSPIKPIFDALRELNEKNTQK